MKSRKANPTLQSVNVAMCLFHTTVDKPKTLRGGQDIPKKINQDSPILKKVNPHKVQDQEIKKIMDDIKKEELKKEIEQNARYFSKIQENANQIKEYQKKINAEYKSNIPPPKKEIVRKQVTDREILEYYEKVNRNDDEKYLKEENDKKLIMKIYYDDLKEQIKIKNELHKKINETNEGRVYTSLNMNSHDQWLQKRKIVQEDVRKSLANQMKYNQEKKLQEKIANMKIVPEKMNEIPDKPAEHSNEGQIQINN